MNIRRSVSPFLLPHVFKHSHGLKKVDTDTTDKLLSDFHNHFIVDTLADNHDSVGVGSVVFKPRVSLMGISTLTFQSYQVTC